MWKIVSNKLYITSQGIKISIFFFVRNANNCNNFVQLYTFCCIIVSNDLLLYWFACFITYVIGFAWIFCWNWTKKIVDGLINFHQLMTMMKKMVNGLSWQNILKKKIQNFRIHSFYDFRNRILNFWFFQDINVLTMNFK